MWNLCNNFAKLSWNMRSTKFNSYNFFQIAQLQKFTLECFPRYWPLKNLSQIPPSSNQKCFLLWLATVHQNLPKPAFYPLFEMPVSYEVLLWSPVIRTLIPQSFANSPYLEKLIPVNLNAGSLPLKNILNDIISSKSSKGILKRKQNLLFP